MLAFEIGASRFALHLDVVQEVIRAVFVSPLPGAPAVVEGIIDVRGEIVPVYDLRVRFGMRPRALDADDRFVLARANERLVAVHCERVDSVFEAMPDAVPQAAALSLGDRRIAGAATLDGGIVLITDLAAFLDDAESAALDDALAAHAQPSA